MQVRLAKGEVGDMGGCWGKSGRDGGNGGVVQAVGNGEAVTRRGGRVT